MAGWQVCSLEEVVKFIDYRGRTPEKTEDGMRLITAKNVKMGYLQNEPMEFVDPKIYDGWMTRGIPKKGDVLFTTEAPLGNIAQLDTDEKVVFAQRIIVMQTSREVLDSTFLKYMLLSNLMQERIHEKGTGATVKGIKAQLLKKVQISFPNSLLEQRRIVAIVDNAFEGIDRTIANTKKNLTNARELFESYLNAAFTQKGDGWVEKKLGDICENLDSRRIPITKSDRKSGDVPYYGASGVVDYVADYIFDEDLLLVSEDGANLLARTYPIAFSISGKTWVNNHAHTLRFDRICSQYFVEYYLNSISLEQYVSGMAQPKLNQKQLNSIPVPFPTQIQQQQIVAKLDELRSETQRLESIYRQKLAALNELKQTILQKAFTGELTADTANQATKIAEGAIAA